MRLLIIQTLGFVKIIVAQPPAPSPSTTMYPTQTQRSPSLNLTVNISDTPQDIIQPKKIM